MINKITPFIENRILDIVRQTKPRLSNIQNQRSVSKYDLQLRTVDHFVYEDEKYTIGENANIRVFQVYNLPLLHNYIHNKKFYISFNEAINRRILIPIILTKITIGEDGNKYENAILWKDMVVVRNEYNDFYLLISNIPDAITDNQIGCIRLPFNIKYNSNIPAKNLFPTIGFVFNDLGEAILSEDDYKESSMSVSIITNDLNYNTFNFPNGTNGFIIDIDKGNVIFQNNLILYKEGLIVTDSERYLTMVRPNTFLFNYPEDCEDIIIKAYYFNRANKSCDNLYNLDHDSIITYLQMDIDGAAPSFIEKLHESLDLDSLIVHNQDDPFDPNNDDYLSILEKRYNKIISYNKKLLFSDETSSEYNLDNLVVDHITGKEIYESEDEDTGICTLPLRRWKNSEGRYNGTFKPIIFVNNELYKYYHTLILNNNDTYSFYSRDISFDDKVEIYYIGQTEDTWEYKEYIINVPSSTKKIKSKWDVRNCMIFEKNPVPIEYPDVVEYDHGTLQYYIDFTCIKEDDETYTINFADSSYYDKDLILVTKDQFLTYSDVSEDGENIHIILPEEFKYAHEPSHYLVFLNGRRIDNSRLEFNIPKKDNPFYEISIYSSIIFQDKDRVDVIYLPFAVSDIAHATDIDTRTGLLTIDANDLPFGLNKENYLLFVNGYKVNNDNINIISDNVLQLTKNIDSVSNITLSLVEMNPNQASSLFMTDDWNDLITSLTDEEIASLYDRVNITDTDISILENETYKKAVLLEIYKDYYGLHYSGIPLNYTTNDTLLDPNYKDRDDNILIDAANARSNTSVNFDDYYERYPS